MKRWWCLSRPDVCDRGPAIAGSLLSSDCLSSVLFLFSVFAVFVFSLLPSILSSSPALPRFPIGKCPIQTDDSASYSRTDNKRSRLGYPESMRMQSAESRITHTQILRYAETQILTKALHSRPPSIIPSPFPPLPCQHHTLFLGPLPSTHHLHPGPSSRLWFRHRSLSWASVERVFVEGLED